MSTTSSSSSRSSSSPKNFEAAFGNLQTTYGFQGAASPFGLGPTSMPRAKPSASTPQSATHAPRTHTVIFPQSSQVTTAPQPKNYEAAFGNLSSSYGFGGSAMMLPEKKEKKSSTSSQRFSIFKK